MEMFLSSNFELIDLDDLELLNGGYQVDYDFAHKVGSTINWIGKELWYNTLGFRSVH